MADKYYIGFAKKKYSGVNTVGQDNKRLYDCGEALIDFEAMRIYFAYPAKAVIHAHGMM